MSTLSGELPADEVADAVYVVHRWAVDGRNHRFDRRLFNPGADMFWPKCTRGKRIPQRTVFASEMGPELGSDRDTSEDCRTCFSTGPRERPVTW